MYLVIEIKKDISLISIFNLISFFRRKKKNGATNFQN